MKKRPRSKLFSHRMTSEMDHYSNDMIDQYPDHVNKNYEITPMTISRSRFDTMLGLLQSTSSGMLVSLRSQIYNKKYYIIIHINY